MPRPRVPAPAPRGAEAATQRGQPEAPREVSSARVVASPDEASGTFEAGSEATDAKPPETHAKPPETDAKSSEAGAKPSESTAKPPEADDTSQRGGRMADEGARSEDAAKRDGAPAPARESMPIVVETESPRDASARPLSEPPTRTAVPGAEEPPPHAVSRIGSPESLEGVTLGRYVLRHLIAQGGMASVYLAQHVADDGFARWVAIKIMHPHLAREPRFVAMFLDEARITSRIVHPNVCAVTDYGKGPPPHLVMEHLFGEALWALVREAAPKGGIPVWLALRVVADAARGLHAAHEARGADGENLEVVHRDVSMQNVFVLYDGVTKVIDFGVAKARERLSSTETGELKGKIAYMAPDVLSGETADRRADVWGLGVVLWELLTNRRLFRGANEGATVHNVLHAPVPAVASIRKDVPPALDAISPSPLTSSVTSPVAGAVLPCVPAASSQRSASSEATDGVPAAVAETTSPSRISSTVGAGVERAACTASSALSGAPSAGAAAGSSRASERADRASVSGVPVIDSSATSTRSERTSSSRVAVGDARLASAAARAASKSAPR